MAGEFQERPAAAKRRQVVSFTRLERKVDQLAARMDTINLNGSAATLMKLAQNADALLKLAEVAPLLVTAIEHERDLATWWKVTRRFLNPLRPLGALIWTVIGTIIASLVWNLLTNHAIWNIVVNHH